MPPIYPARHKGRNSKLLNKVEFTYLFNIFQENYICVPLFNERVKETINLGIKHFFL